MQYWTQNYRDMKARAALSAFKTFAQVRRLL